MGVLGDQSQRDQTIQPSGKWAGTKETGNLSPNSSNPHLEKGDKHDLVDLSLQDDNVRRTSKAGRDQRWEEEVH